MGCKYVHSHQPFKLRTFCWVFVRIRLIVRRTVPFVYQLLPFVRFVADRHCEGLVRQTLRFTFTDGLHQLGREILSCFQISIRVRSQSTPPLTHVNGFLPIRITKVVIQTIQPRPFAHRSSGTRHGI